MFVENPKMLNKRIKTKVIKSFEGVVSHGKKINKRSSTKADGGDSGLYQVSASKRSDSLSL